MTVGLYKDERKFLNKLQKTYDDISFWELKYLNDGEKWDKFLSQIEIEHVERLKDFPYKVVIDWNYRITSPEYSMDMWTWLETHAGHNGYELSVDYKNYITNVFFADKRTAFMFKLKWS
jgi:hypothetical protein